MIATDSTAAGEPLTMFLKRGERPPPAWAARWLTRRRTSCLLVAGAVMSSGGIAGWVDSQSALSVAEAKQFIQRSGDRLVAILQGLPDRAARRREMQGLINESVDVDGIVRFALGRYWKLATSDQRDAFIRLFPLILTADLEWIFGAYQGVRFTIDRAASAGDGVEVWTTVIRPAEAILPVSWLIARVQGVTKVIDIIGEGTSLRIAQRSDCNRFMAQNNHTIADLIDSMRRQVEVAS